MGQTVCTIFCRTSHWIDVSFDEVSLAWVEYEVLSSKGDHPRLSAAARHLGHPVRLKTTACDHLTSQH